ncbi:ribosome silencing factor [Paratissierella segnis]|jgi:ribosome-associated protein|uniref:Ribosomal silencing factor RsfS n=1 Tax=Paratissierella segnis TaxID=2763679 RepID=A0A926IKS9_9FIRM|nr:ribosome silencing factor [Paratissierella segnis]MBC8588826.1 ribosome silencing factor [Paratissierella segnis]
MSESDKKLSVITKAIDDKKGFDVKVLDVSHLTPIAEYFVIASGNSSTQVMAIADEIESQMFLAGYDKMSNMEGYHSGRWILIDYNDIIVHVFHKDERDFYNLERLWTRIDN